MASETQSLLGSVKRIRAIADLVYLGRSIRGRRQARVDGKLGAYEIVTTQGEEFECDQAFAKGAVMSGKAELVSGGLVDVVHQADGYPTYQRWIRDPVDPDSVYERCELLRPLFFGDGCLLPAGSKVRLDVTTFWDRSRVSYEDEELTDLHQIRVQKLSPKKVRINQAETAGKVNALFNKFFPQPATQ